MHRSVSNQDTQYIHELFQDDPYAHTNALKKGGDEYYAILGTQNGLGTSFLLEQHKEFSNKEILEIKWKELEEQSDLKFFIGDKESIAKLVYRQSEKYMRLYSHPRRNPEIRRRRMMTH